MKKFRFRKFQVYQDARKLILTIKNFSKEKFPKEEKYALRSQLWRALDSIILNIAEGSDRSTDKDFALFLNRAHTSLNEVVAVLDIALDLEYITKDDHAKYLEKSELLANQITAFRRKLINNF
ncbi:MAG: four helix bundle protein [Candidatus Pacebacteria bacterium]|nr:four helix bundle protein [Candidatus Paceibacterota bacterium]